MKFRKKPIVIDAARWFKNGDHPNDYSRDHHGYESGEPRTFTAEERKARGWEGDIVRYYRHPDVPGAQRCQHCDNTMHAHGWIDTLEGGHTVCPGDWIIRGVKGEYYPCKPDVFEATYEAADTQCLKSSLEDIERETILARLALNRGNKPATAKSLGISLKTLYNKLNAYRAAQGLQSA